MRKRLLVAVATALGFAFAAEPANATFIYSNYSVVNDQNVTIIGPGNFNETVGSGQIVLQSSDGTLPTWCIDIFDYLANSGSYNFSNTPSNNGTEPPAPPSAALTNAQIGEIGALIVYGDSHLNDSFDVSSGTQIAIWETEDGGLGYSFNGSAGADAVAASLLASPLTPYFGWDMLYSVDNQGLVNNQGLSTIPEPSSLALLVAALGGIWFISRLKRPLRAGLGRLTSRGIVMST